MAPQIFSNSTHSGEPTWVPNPTTRGTANILVTCLLTLLLCIWKAVHLNLPEYGNPRFCCLEYQTWRKIGWLVVSLIAPELVVYAAWSQLLEARGIMKYYNEKCPGKSWTLVHGFYAIMGGFAFETPAAVGDGQGMPDSRLALGKREIKMLIDEISNPRLFSHRGVSTIAADSNATGHSAASREDPHPTETTGSTDAITPVQTPLPGIPQSPADDHWDPASFLDVPTGDILDKSKSDWLGKALVCVQAVWFCAQCATRIAQGLPITLLKLNTFGPSVCAVVIYLVWWYKPADVERPTIWVIQGTKQKALWSALNLNRTVREVCPPSNTLWDARRYFKGEDRIPADRRYMYGRVRLDTSGQQALEKRARSEVGPGWFFKEHTGVARFGEGDEKHFCPGVAITIPALLLYRHAGDRTAVIWSPSQGSSAVHEAAATNGAFYGILRTGDHRSGDEYKYPLGNPTLEAIEPAARLRRRTRNWPRFETSDPLRLFSFFSLSALYGGLHCLAWNAHFPSPAERVMWRASSIVLLTAAFPALASVFLYTSGPYLKDELDADRSEKELPALPLLERPRWYIIAVTGSIKSAARAFRHRELRSRLVYISKAYFSPRGILYKLINALLVATITLSMALILAARTYLIVECFIQLAHLPPGPIFTVPNWAAYFPHLG